MSLYDKFQRAFADYADRPALYERAANAPGHIPISYRELGGLVEHIAGGLQSLGLGKGDRLALYSENRTDWLATDIACLGLGIVTVPIHAIANPKDLEYILGHSESKAIVASEKYLPKVQAVARPATLQHLISMDGEADGVRALHGLAGEPRAPRWPGDLSLLDNATIIYTSGTTAEPKGALMDHHAIWRNVKAIGETFKMARDGERIVSYLPLSHCYERFAGEYTMLLSGGAVMFSGIDTLREDIGRFNPTIFLAVPRVYEKFYQGIQSLGWLKKALFGILPQKTRRKKLFGKDVRFATSSAAALSPDVAKFFRESLGLTIIEAYGMTEGVSAITSNRLEDNVPNTVGKPLPGYSVRLGPAITEAGEDLTEYADAEKKTILRGEVQFTGPQMVGYYKNPAATQAMRTEDGWLKTGDLGTMDTEGRLCIVGRAKEQFKLANGKYVAPGPLEDILKTSPYVADAMVYGDDQRDYVVGLVVPNGDALKQRFGDAKLDELVSRADVRKLFADEIGRLFKEYERFKQPTAFTLLAEPFTITNNMLTPTFKLKRRVVAQRYKDAIEGMYAGKD
jgi:long-chain acyl-CoA synthetase